MRRKSPLVFQRFNGPVFSRPALAIIRAWLSENTLCREHLARRVCQEFGWSAQRAAVGWQRGTA